MNHFAHHLHDTTDELFIWKVVGLTIHKERVKLLEDNIDPEVSGVAALSDRRPGQTAQRFTSGKNLKTGAEMDIKYFTDLIEFFMQCNICP